MGIGDVFFCLYFYLVIVLDRFFEVEINYNNFFGIGGRLVIGFVVLFRVLWKGIYYVF